MAGQVLMQGTPKHVHTLLIASVGARHTYEAILKSPCQSTAVLLLNYCPLVDLLLPLPPTPLTLP